MTFTPAQYQILKAYIASIPTWASLPKNDDSAFFIASQLNLTASPSFIVWKTNVTVRETGQAFVGSEWAGMTSANHTRLQTVAQYLEAYSPAVQGIRDMFNDIWSGAGGTLTRAALLALWKRPATVFEKLFATGTGSDIAPATMVLEGNVSYQDVSAAWNS